MFKRLLLILLSVFVVLTSVSTAHADWSYTNFGQGFELNNYEGTTDKEPPGHPPSGCVWLYSIDGVMYYEVSSGVSSILTNTAQITLQNAYDNSNTITTSGTTDIVISLGASATNILLQNTYAGTQAVALEIDSKADARAITTGLLFSASGAGSSITTAIDASDSQMTTAISVGYNAISGTTPVVNFDNFDIDASGNVITAGSATVNGTGLYGDGTTLLQGFRSGVTDVVGATYALTIADSGKTFTNAGSGTTVTFTLPEASTAIGCTYTFVNCGTTGLAVDPEASDVIAGICTEAGHMLRSITLGSSITLRATSAVNWVVTAVGLRTEWVDTH